MHYYKRNIGDYAKKAGRLSLLEHGAYTLLIDACYDRERFPTMKEAIEWSWARSAEEIAAVEFVLCRFFTLEDGLYVQDRIREEIEAYQLNSDKNRQIATEREEKRRNRARTVHEPSPVVHEPPPNQEPRTTNQEPKEEKTPRKRSAPVSGKQPVHDRLLTDAGFSSTEAAEFIAHKAAMKAPLTDRAWRDHLAESQKAGWTPLQAAEKVMAKGWKGFEAKYVANELPRSKAAPVSFADHDEQVRRRKWEEMTNRKWPETGDVFDTPVIIQRIEA